MQTRGVASDGERMEVKQGRDKMREELEEKKEEEPGEDEADR